MVKRWLLWILGKLIGTQLVYVDDVVKAKPPLPEEEVK